MMIAVCSTRQSALLKIQATFEVKIDVEVRWKSSLLLESGFTFQAFLTGYLVANESLDWWHKPSFLPIWDASPSSWNQHIQSLKENWKFRLAKSASCLFGTWFPMFFQIPDRYLSKWINNERKFNFWRSFLKYQYNGYKQALKSSWKLFTLYIWMYLKKWYWKSQNKYTRTKV